MKLRTDVYSYIFHILQLNVNETVSKIVKIVHEIRNLNLMKKPSVRGTVDWVRSVSSLGTKNFNKSLEDSIGVAIKTESDKKRVLKDVIHKKY